MCKLNLACVFGFACSVAMCALSSLLLLKNLPHFLHLNFRSRQEKVGSPGIGIMDGSFSGCSGEFGIGGILAFFGQSEVTHFTN